MAIKSAIFDMDGTLLDSMYIWDTVGIAYLQSIGVVISPELRDAFVTMSIVQSAEYCVEKFNLKYTAKEVLRGIRKEVDLYYRNEIPLKASVELLLSELHRRNIPMCVATATEKDLALATLTRCGIAQYFSEIFTVSEVGYSKETPHIYNACREHLGTDLADTWVFEDAYYAVKTAKNAGYHVVAISDTAETKGDEVSKIADAYIHDFAEVLELI